LTVRRNKPWFGPIPFLGKGFVPVCWEGCAVTVAFGLGLGLLTMVRAPIQRSVAMALVVVAFGAIVLLTWEDPDTAARRGWRDRLLNKQTAIGSGLMLLLFAAIMATAYACDVAFPRAVFVAACKRAPSEFRGPLTGR
jgi:hypothetical protein